MQKEFERSGIISLGGFFPSSSIDPIRQRVYASFENRGARKNGYWQYKKNDLIDLPDSEVKLIRKELKETDELQLLDHGKMISLASALTKNQMNLNSSEDEKSPWQFLITLPTNGQWVVPYSMWHLDFPRLPHNQPIGLQIFTFLDQVEPKGGGTLVIAGSHRMLNCQDFMSSKEVKRRLNKQEHFFAKLFSPKTKNRENLLLDKGRSGDVDLSIIELTGNPGDIYLIDLRLFHAVSSNTSNRPRLMLTNRFFCQKSINLWQRHVSAQG